jgi:hypothetical protein
MRSFVACIKTDTVVIVKKHHNIFISKNSFLFRCYLFITLIFCLNSCAVSLVPRYEQAIVDDLSIASNEIFQLTASLSPKASASDFSKRESDYNKVIGRIEALEFQIKARPIPKNKQVETIINKVNEHLKAKGINTLIDVNDISPSATALKNLRENIEKMKEVDQQQGITKTELKVFKGFIELYLDQTLTYEKYLHN